MRGIQKRLEICLGLLNMAMDWFIIIIEAAHGFLRLNPPLLPSSNVPMHLSLYGLGPWSEKSTPFQIKHSSVHPMDAYLFYLLHGFLVFIEISFMSMMYWAWKVREWLVGGYWLCNPGCVSLYLSSWDSCVNCKDVSLIALQRKGHSQERNTLVRRCEFCIFLFATITVLGIVTEGN